MPELPRQSSARPRLSDFQRRLLDYIARHDGFDPVAARAATGALGTNLPNLSRSVRILIERGLLNGPVVRGQRPSGRPRRVYVVTESGRAALDG